MKVEDIARTVFNTIGEDYESLSEVEKGLRIAGVKWLQENSVIETKDFHYKLKPDVPYKEMNQKQKEYYKVAIAMVKNLSKIDDEKPYTVGSDEKGQFVECKSAKVQSTPFCNEPIDLSGLNLTGGGKI